MISIVYSTRKENLEYQEKIKNSIGLKDIEILEYVNNGEKSLPEIYNDGLKKSKYDIVLFLHDDLLFDSNNFGRKILKHIEKNPDHGIVGVAGTTDLINGKWWTLKESMVGIVNHQSEGKKWTSHYSEDIGNKIKDVVVVDGLFFFVQKNKLKHYFDEDFKGFHFYDLSFCLPNFLDGVKIGVVTDIRITHLSIGMTNNQWEENKNLFEEKYKSSLPIRLTNNKTFEEKLLIDKDKIGVGMVTYNAEHRIKESAFRVPKWVKHFVIVNDGTPYNDGSYPEHAHIIQHKNNECVGKSKNDAIKWLLEKGCEHIFIIEDDILINDENVFEQYIRHSLISGIKHLNFALHGPANKKNNQGFSSLEERALIADNGDPNPRMVINYEDGVKIALYPNCVGAFSYYDRKALEKIGLFDPHFKNAWEHVDHTYEAYKKGLHPPFWYFADIDESWKYLSDIPNSIQNSTIARTPEWNKNFKNGSEYYKRKHGVYPTQTPLIDPKVVQQQLQILYTNRG